jgi:hypothetical protein
MSLPYGRGTLPFASVTRRASLQKFSSFVRLILDIYRLTTDTSAATLGCYCAELSSSQLPHHKIPNSPNEHAAGFVEDK